MMFYKIVHVKNNIMMMEQVYVKNVMFIVLNVLVMQKDVFLVLDLIGI